jgi:hypothetical protein
MLEGDKMMQKYFDKKLAPNIRNEKIFRKDVLD